MLKTFFVNLLINSFLMVYDGRVNDVISGQYLNYEK